MAQSYDVTVTRSAGTDGAVVVFIDGDFEIAGGLRILVNDADAYHTVQYEQDDTDRDAKQVSMTFTLPEIEYLP